MGVQKLFQLLNCFCTKLSQFLAGVAGAEAAQRGKVSSGAAVKAVRCADQLQVSLLHVTCASVDVLGIHCIAQGHLSRTSSMQWRESRRFTVEGCLPSLV